MSKVTVVEVLEFNPQTGIGRGKSLGGDAVLIDFKDRRIIRIQRNKLGFTMSQKARVRKRKKDPIPMPQVGDLLVGRVTPEGWLCPWNLYEHYLRAREAIRARKAKLGS